MKHIFTLLAVLIFTMGFSQQKEIHRLKLKHFDESELVIKLSREAQRLEIKEGYKIRVSCLFELNGNGSLKNVKARGQTPQFESITENHWKELKFPNEKIKKDIDFSNSVFNVAIVFDMMSDEKINQLVVRKLREDKKARDKN